MLLDRSGERRWCAGQGRPRADAPVLLRSLTADLVRAFVSNNKISATEVPGLTEVTYAALSDLGRPKSVVPTEAEYVPAVSVRRSLASPDHIISMIDGKPYMTLRRHLTSQGLTPDEYRARYKLPADYPMVARTYSEKRSQMANDSEFGKKGRGAKAAAKPATNAARGKLKLFGNGRAAGKTGQQG